MSDNILDGILSTSLNEQDLYLLGEGSKIKFRSDSYMGLKDNRNNIPVDVTSEISSPISSEEQTETVSSYEITPIQGSLMEVLRTGENERAIKLSDEKRTNIVKSAIVENVDSLDVLPNSDFEDETVSLPDNEISASTEDFNELDSSELTEDFNGIDSDVNQRYEEFVNIMAQVKDEGSRVIQTQESLEAIKKETAARLDKSSGELQAAIVENKDLVERKARAESELKAVKKGVLENLKSQIDNARDQLNRDQRIIEEVEDQKQQLLTDTAQTEADNQKAVEGLHTDSASLAGEIDSIEREKQKLEEIKKALIYFPSNVSNETEMGYHNRDTATLEETSQLDSQPQSKRRVA